MKYYSVMPQDWDYTKEEKVGELIRNGKFTPCMVVEIANKCGSLFPYVTSKSNAIKYTKSLKREFPYVVFNLMEGERWGELKLVESF